MLVRTVEVKTVPTSATHTPRRSGGTVRRVTVTLLVAAIALGGELSAGAVPPPPDNPSDAELRESERAARQRADEVGRLANELAQARTELGERQAEVALRMEEANRALVDLRKAKQQADAAERAARAARAETREAADALASAREAFDRFAAASYRQGSTVGSIRAYLGADEPAEVLDRGQLIGALSGTHRETMRTLREARVRKANADAQARQAAAEALRRRDEAEQAEAAADRATVTAVRARRAQATDIGNLQQRQQRVRQRLDRARQAVAGLEGQRDRYEQWQRRKRAEAEQAAEPQAQTGTATPAPVPAQAGTAAPGATPEQATVERVIARARSQLGVPYAWGGGNASGPTYGIRDGGVADAHGDYNKVGFDCSGLMIYAFAPVTSLPHYSGYQYHSGRKVPLSRMRRGDMLFWGPDRIHHVALYLGDGMMIEAPYSGGHVRIAPVRYDGIMPYATRLIG